MTIGLALSGGGALGVAHIGILEEMERHHLRIDMLSGTSAGAIIGLLYADGGLPALDAFLNELTERGISNNPGLLLFRRPESLFEEIRAVLRRHVAATSFASLHMPFCCVATDIIDGSMVVLRDGDPVAAVMASAAYPGVFPAQRIDGRFYVDGGVTRNLPADVLRQSGADFIIGSSLYALLPLPKSQTRLNLTRIQAVLRALDVQQLELSLLQLPFCNFCFAPPIESFRWHDFDRVDILREVGRRYAGERIGELLRVLADHKQV